MGACGVRDRHHSRSLRREKQIEESDHNDPLRSMVERKEEERMKMSQQNSKGEKL